MRPESVVLVHGAASGPWVFDGWRDAFGTAEIEAVDLQAGLNVAEASMSNYAAVVARGVQGLRRPLVLCGWSLGGLAVMMAARSVEPEALVLLEPSPPAEVQGTRTDVRPAPGTYDGEEAYGAFPPSIRSRPESALARAERQAGISVPRLPPATLVAYGDEFREERGTRLADHYGAERLYIEGVDHWGLVLEQRAPRAVAARLEAF